MADEANMELLVAERLYNIWRGGGPTPIGKSWKKLTTTRQHRWVNVAHAVLKVQNA